VKEAIKKFFLKVEKEDEDKPESLFLKILEEERIFICKKGLDNV
jgi:hypothetical protein